MVIKAANAWNISLSILTRQKFSLKTKQRKMSFIKLCLLVLFVAVAESQRPSYRDPCRNIDCGDYGCCRRKDGYYSSHLYRHRNFECVCDDGYYWDKNDNTCKFGCTNNRCHRYASCYVKAKGSIDYPGGNQYGGYRNDYYYCQCNRGYRGNGRECVRIDPCYDHKCHGDAVCKPKRAGVTHVVGRSPNHFDYKSSSYYCECKDGYYGNGRRCFPYCHNHNCHQYATCVGKPYGSLDFPGRHSAYRYLYYYCRCNDGYEGNGRECRRRDPCDNANCHRYATCTPKKRGVRYPVGTYLGYTDNDYYCQCNENYYGNGRTCTASCYGNDCDQYATCVPKRHGRVHGVPNIYSNDHYYCRCRDGYTGNGRECIKDCCPNRECHAQAKCIPKKRKTEYPGYGNYLGYYNECYRCECNRGFYGNGKLCIRRYG